MTFPNPSVRSSQASGTSVLDRLSSQSSFNQSGALSSTQSQVDGLVTRFVDEAANPRTLAAITLGSAAYRFGRLGVMALGEGRLAAMPLRMLSVGVGLGTEVTAF